MTRVYAFIFFLVGFTVFSSFSVSAKEYPAGKPVLKGGMEVAAVYLQAITMSPKGMMRPAAQSDIHLEADIHALDSNKNGFAEGDWVPYLEISFELKKAGEDKPFASGMLMPMVANDGPHYGDNVKMQGPGIYELTFHVAPPKPLFGRHIDKETGVAEWFKPFETTYKFVFAGVGKKGAY